MLNYSLYFMQVYLITSLPCKKKHNILSHTTPPTPPWDKIQLKKPLIANQFIRKQIYFNTKLKISHTYVQTCMHYFFVYTIHSNHKQKNKNRINPIQKTINIIKNKNL